MARTRGASPRRRFGLVAVAIMLGTSGAQAADRVETLAFARGAMSATRGGVIRGYDGISYRIGARAGQQMSVRLDPSSRSCFMNVTAPGADAAVFNGSADGNRYAATLAVSGEQSIQVYLMRNAARRNEACRYRLTVAITDPKGSPGVASDAALQARCRSEAAGMYGVAPAQIAMAVPRRVAAGVEIDGTADKGKDSIKKLRCLFAASGAFDRIMAMTPDGE